MSHQIFTPPVAVKQGPASAGHPMWRFFRADVGITVLKQQGGAYVQRQYVSQSEVDAAAAVYLGGHVYVVTPAEVTSLTAAGYGAYITTVPDDPAPTFP